MKKSLKHKYRQLIPEGRRIIVKIGTKVLVQKTGRPDLRRMKSLVKEIAQLKEVGFEVIVVSSGAVGAGMEALRMEHRPTNLPDLQMAAAVGQPRLMCRYSELFSKLGCRIGQVLLTHYDFHHKIRMTNIRRTMENLIRSNVIPIVNENDVVADEEIKADLALGDNDYLASLLVKLIRADLMIMLTTVDGVRMRGASGRTQRISFIESITNKIYKHISQEASTLSKGGMFTKIKAARSISKAGCSTVIANGCKRGVLAKIMKGEDVGTLILPMGN